MKSARSALLPSFRSSACTAPSIGTLVNSDSRSRDTMISFSWIFLLGIVEATWAKFSTVKLELPVI